MAEGLSVERIAEIERLTTLTILNGDSPIDVGSTLNAALSELLSEVKRLRAGTVEYAVQCATGNVNEAANLYSRDDADGLSHWLDNLALNGCTFCSGPHRVVHRLVGPWQPVDPEEPPAG